MIKARADEVPFLLLCCLMLMLPPISAVLGYAMLYPLLIHHFGPQSIPYLYLSIAILSFITTLIYMFLLKVTHIERLVIIFSAFTAIALLINRFFILPNPETLDQIEIWRWSLYLLLLLFAYICSNTLIPIQVLSSITSVVLPSQSKRFYVIFFFSIILGRIIGSIIVSSSVKFLGVNNLMVIWFFTTLLLIPLTSLLYNPYRKRIFNDNKWMLSAQKESDVSKASYKEFLSYVFNTKMAIVLIAVKLFSWIINVFIESQYAKIISNHFSSSESLSEFYGYYFIFRNSAILLGYLFVTTRFINYFGVIRSMMTVPLVCSIGFVLITIRFDFINGLFLYFFFEVAVFTIDSVATQLAANVVPEKFREHMRGLVWGIMFSVGTLLGVIIYMACQFSIYDQHSINLTNGIALLVIIIWLSFLYKGKNIYIDNLILNIKNENRKTAMDAIESLNETKEPKAYDTILSVLTDPENRFDIEMKGAAMRVLVRLGFPKAIRALYLYLDDPEPRLRLYAITSLARFKNISQYTFALHVINNKLKDFFFNESNKLVRFEAAKFLINQLPKDDFLSLCDRIYKEADSTNRIVMIHCIRQIDHDLIDLVLLKGLQDPDPNVYSEVLVGLSRFDEYLNIFHCGLVKLLRSDDEACRVDGLKAVILTCSRLSCLSEIMLMLNDPSPVVRCFAGVAYLSDRNRDPNKVNEILDQTLKILSDPNLFAAYREEFATLMPYFDQEVIDMLVDAAQMLPDEQRTTAFKSFQKLGYLLDEKFEHQIISIDLSMFVRGLQFGS